MYESHESKLVSGKIPAFTKCPFLDNCGFFHMGDCHHKGIEHTVDYSCGAARAHDLIDRVKPGSKTIFINSKSQT